MKGLNAERDHYPEKRTGQDIRRKVPPRQNPADSRADRERRTDNDGGISHFARCLLSDERYDRASRSHRRKTGMPRIKRSVMRRIRAAGGGVEVNKRSRAMSEGVANLVDDAVGDGTFQKQNPVGERRRESLFRADSFFEDFKKNPQQGNCER